MDQVKLGMDIQKSLNDLKLDLDVLQKKMSSIAELITEGFEFEQKFKEISDRQ